MTVMWKKTMLILLVLSLPQNYIFSQGKSFLWKIEYRGGASYLLGSVHTLKQEHYPLNATIETAFTQTEALAVEADISSPNAMEAGMQLLQKGMYTGDEKLEKNISRKTMNLLQKKLQELNMENMGFSQFKPWMVAMVLLQTELAKMGFDPNLGIDKYFLDKAANKKEVVELEGVEFQVKLLESFTKSESEAFLLSTILEIDQLKTELDKMIEAWMAGNIHVMEELLTGYVKKNPEVEALYRKMNDDRNVGMVQKIESYLKSGKRYFVIAGAAHMIGKNGIVQTLKNKGYTVTQL